MNDDNCAERRANTAHVRRTGLVFASLVLLDNLATNSVSNCHVRASVCRVYKVILKAAFNERQLICVERMSDVNFLDTARETVTMT